MIKLLIFDLDGTLADTLPSIQHAIELSMSHYGFRAPTPKETADALGSGARELLKRLLPQEFAKDDSNMDEFVAYYNKMYKTTYMEADKCYEGMAEAVIELKKRGYTIAVLSNKQEDYVVNMIANLFEAGIVSSAKGQTDLPTKPDPTVPRMMLEELGFSASEAAFIGDSDVDIYTARNSDMTAVACSWGFRAREMLEKLGADFIIDTPEELLDIFK